MKQKIAIVVTNHDRYDESGKPTGLWLSELVHFTEVAEQAGFEWELVSPGGGRSPLEPRSLRGFNWDKVTRQKYEDPAYMKRLEETRPASDADPADYDAVYFTGGHAVMYDFPDDPGVQQLTAGIYERGGVVSSVCHGYCGILNTRLSSGDYLIDGKRMTGFSWLEERLAGVAKLVPYNAEEVARERGADYHKSLLPFAVHVEVDGRLVTGQNPRSAKRTAEKTIETLRATAS